MTSLMHAFEIGLAVILFVLLVIIFFKVFGSTDCDSFANTTSIDLADAINRVSLGSDVLAWDQDSVPGEDQTDYYVAVPIRLCEVNTVQSLAAQFVAQSPTYILVYETMPEGGLAWSESQPFSGGAAESLENYALMKYGIKGATLAPKLVRVVKQKIGATVKSIVFRGFVNVLATKFRSFVESAKNNWLVKRFLKAIGRGSTLSTVDKDLPDVLKSKYYGKTYSGFIEGVKNMVVYGNMDLDEALTRRTFYEGHLDAKTGVWVADLVNGKKVVRPEFKDLFYTMMENADEAQLKKWADTVTIKPKHAWTVGAATWIKSKTWTPLKNKVVQTWKDSTLKKYIYDAPKALYDKINGKLDDTRNWLNIGGKKQSMNQILNYQDTLEARDLPKRFQIIKDIALENKDSLKKTFADQVAKGDDNLIKAIERFTGKTVSKADDITDDIIISYVDNLQRAVSSKNMVLMLPKDLTAKELENLVGDEASERLSKRTFNLAEKMQTSTDPQSIYDSEVLAFRKEFSQRSQSEQQELIKSMTAGFTVDGRKITMSAADAEKAYNQYRLELGRRGLLNPALQTGSNGIMVSNVIAHLDDVNSQLISKNYKNVIKSGDAENILKYLTAPELGKIDRWDPAIFKASSYAWQRGKRAVFLDLNRIAEGPLAPYNVIPNSPYSMEQNLQKESTIQEGGCQEKSICKLQKGKATGASDTSTSYLLDKKVTDAINVKLWRPDQDASAISTNREVVGVNTQLLSMTPTENPRFYLVSPCFGIAKVWKNGNDVFVNVEKTRKCDVSGCDQASVELPVSIPLIGNQIGLASIDTPNYCYADTDFIWGNDDSPNLLTYLAIYGTCTGMCAAASSVAGGSTIRQCIKACEYPTIGVLMADVTLSTQAYRDVSSWQRQDTGWGYWNYQKAGDVCDLIDTIASIGGTSPKGGIVESKFFKSSVGAKLWTTGGKVNKAAGLGMGDLCYAIQYMGDTSLAWPIKTPQPDFWRKGAIMDEVCMKESAGKCTWLVKCDPNNPAINQCPVGSSCSNGNCIEQACDTINTCPTGSTCTGGTCKAN